ncbi:MAG: hypothetical protein AAF356_08795 [Planctomycetota bacterium]
MTQTPAGSMPTAPHRGVLILVLGILSVVLCAPIGPFAWLMGQGDLKKIKSGLMDPEGKGLTLAGMICGIVGSVFLIFWVLYIILIVVLGIGVAAAGAAGAAP